MTSTGLALVLSEDDLVVVGGGEFNENAEVVQIVVNVVTMNNEKKISPFENVGTWIIFC